eukprot:3152491-Rhodomonas_salina.1
MGKPETEVCLWFADSGAIATLTFLAADAGDRLRAARASLQRGLRADARAHPEPARSPRLVPHSLLALPGPDRRLLLCQASGSRASSVLPASCIAALALRCSGADAAQGGGALSSRTSTQPQSSLRKRYPTPPTPCPVSSTGIAYAVTCLCAVRGTGIAYGGIGLRAAYATS